MKEFFSRWLKRSSTNPSSFAPSNNAAAPEAGRDDVVRQAKQLAKAGNFKQAVALLAPLAAKPEADINLLLILGNSYLLNGQTRQAIDVFERARDRDPANASIALNLANALRDLGNVAQASETLHRLLQRDRHVADALDLLGVLHLDVDDPETALQWFDRALALSPQHIHARFNRSCALLAAGRSNEAWTDHELRAAASYLVTRPITPQLWNGEPARDKRLLIYAEQGVGEEILFASCFTAAALQVEQCTVECSTKLHRLFAQSFPKIEFLPRNWHGTRELPPEQAQFDIVLAAGSLLPRFRSTPENVTVPYLTAEPQRVAAERERLRSHGPGPYIGLCWRGGTRFTRQRFRSLAPDDLATLFTAAPHATFVSLQHTADAAEIDELRRLSGGRFVHANEPLVDMADTAALMAALDLTITIPTTIVYLASAMNLPVWVCTTRGAGWKYGFRGDSSPWFPGARLFRQREHFAWREVLDTIAGELRNWNDARR